MFGLLIVSCRLLLMRMKILVTGVNGFVGKHLVRELVDRGHEVFGVGQHPYANPQIATLLAAYWPCDLTNRNEVKKLSLTNLQAVIGLAGLAKVGESFNDPYFYNRVNVMTLTVIAEEILSQSLKPRVLAISTGAVYKPGQAMPLSEDSELTGGNASPYALSKLKMEEAAGKLVVSGLDCVIARPFNHIGPGQESGFLLPDLYEKIRNLQDSQSAIKVGDLSTRRDYTDVRDVVKAYAGLVAAKKLNHKVYNICSGKSTSGKEILDLLSISSGSQGIDVEQDASLIRPSDPREIYGSYERLKSDIGWMPQIPLAKTISDFVSAHS